MRLLGIPQILVVSSHGVFFLAFGWASMVGILLQFVVLPFIVPDLNGGHGLLKGGDWIWFHSAAVEHVTLMQHEGWRSWKLRPHGNAPIGIAAAVYFLTGVSEPFVLLPLNAAMFALGAVCLYRIFSSLSSKRLAFMATLPFVLFPSAAMIYGQIHKDVFSIAGLLLVTLVWVQFAQDEKSDWRSVLGRIACIAIGCLLIWTVRSYLLQPLIFTSLLATLLLVFTVSRKREVVWWLGILFCLLTLVIIYKIPVAPVAPAAPVAPVAPAAPAEPATPAFLDETVAQLDTMRVSCVNEHPNAGSNIDSTVRFRSLWNIVTYIPRALQIGLLSPFPSMWISDGASPGSSTMRLLSGMEMAVSYLLLIGIGLFLYVIRSNRPTLFIVILIAVTLIFILSLAICNIGTLYRMRYSSWQLLNGLGILGWGSWLSRRYA